MGCPNAFVCLHIWVLSWLNRGYFYFSYFSPFKSVKLFCSLTSSIIDEKTAWVLFFFLSYLSFLFRNLQVDSYFWRLEILFFSPKMPLFKCFSTLLPSVINLSWDFLSPFNQTQVFSQFRDYFLPVFLRLWFLSLFLFLWVL